MVAHVIVDFTPLSPFRKKVLDAKYTGKKDKYIFVHALTSASYKTIAIIISNLIIPLSQYKPFLFTIWFTFLLILFFLVETTTHFIVDVFKSEINIKCNLKCNSSDETYWIILGIDQLLHILVMFAICYCLYS
jgi:hypothetical protein